MTVDAAPIAPNQLSVKLKSDATGQIDTEKVVPPPVVTTIITIEKDGWRSWTICFAACFIQALIIGVMHSYGVFYVEFIKDFNCGKAQAAWVGAIAYGLTLFCGIMCSPLIHRFGHQAVSIVGCCMCCTSLVATSFVHSIDMAFLTFSLLYGIGSSLSYTATVTLVGSFFNKYLVTATGVTMAGSSIGTLIMNPTSQALVSSHGWRTTFQILAGIIMLSIGLSWLMKTPESSTETGPDGQRKGFCTLLGEFQMFKRTRYLIWVLGLFFIMFGYYIPYVHMVPYAITNGISAETGSILVMVLGASTTTGRIIFGRIAENPVLNKLYVCQTSCFLMGVGSMVLPYMTTIPSLVTYVIIAGLLDGGYVVMLPILTNMYGGGKQETLFLSWGILVGICAIPYTFGAPVSGWLVDVTGRYDIAFQVAGAIIMIGSLILIAITLVERFGKPEEESLIMQLPEMDIERCDILPSLEVLGVVSNSKQEVNISTGSFDSIVVLGIKSSKQRDAPSDVTIGHETHTDNNDIAPLRYQSPTVLTNPLTGRLVPSTRMPRQRTVSVGDQDLLPRRFDANTHTDGVVLDIRDVINPFSRDIIVSCYSAVDLAENNK